MGRVFDGALSPNPHLYLILGRTAEIARSFRSPVGAAEHLFLGILHDGGWLVSVLSGLVDPGQAEAAVLGIMGSPGYSPPPAPRFPARAGDVNLLGAEVAIEMGDSYLGAEHAFMAMIRDRATVPARALATLAGLDAVEAAVIAAKNATASSPADAVYLPAGQQMDGPLRKAVIGALPEGSTFGFNYAADERTWMHVFGPDGSLGPEVTREVLNTALTSLDRPPLGGLFDALKVRRR
jgi:hypothetical protein